MNRYNKSIIGLMEQCNTGNWVRYSDVEQTEKDLKEAVKMAKVYEQLFNEAKEAWNDDKVFYCNTIANDSGVISGLSRWGTILAAYLGLSIGVLVGVILWYSTK